MIRFKRLIYLIFLVTVIGLSVPALARRGGSFGFRGGFGRGFSSRSIGRSFHGGYHTSRGFGGFYIFPMFWSPWGGSLITLLILGGIAYFIYSRFSRSAGSLTSSEKAYVTRVSIGFYGSESGIQRGLNQLARMQIPEGPQGQAYLLRETILFLLRHIDGVSHVAYEQHPKLDVNKARTIFESLSSKLRSAYDESALRRDEMGIREDTQGKGNDGVIGGYVVVSVVVAYLEPGLAPLSVTGISDLTEALQALSGIGEDQLLAFDAIWDPFDEGRFLTEDELMTSYPDMIKL